MRHADAGAARTSATADAARRLSAAGIRAARGRARALRRHVDAVDTILTSPLPRAAETAAIVARAYRVQPTVLAALAPGAARAALLQDLRRGRGGTLIVVGHEPDLSRLACWLLAGPRHAFIALAKAGCCALSLRQWRARGAELLWLWA